MKWLRQKNSKSGMLQRPAMGYTPDCVNQATRLLGMYSGILTELNRSKTVASATVARENMRM